MAWKDGVEGLVLANIAKFGDAVTYSLITAGAFDSDLGACPLLRQDVAMTALVGRVETRDLGPARQRLEECTFSVFTDRLPAGFDRDDLVVGSDGRVWDIVDNPRRCMGKVTDLRCQRTDSVGGVSVMRTYEGANYALGPVNGINAVFVLAHSPRSLPEIFHDGLRQGPNDYTWDGDRTITFQAGSIPANGSGPVMADYQY